MSTQTRSTSPALDLSDKSVGELVSTLSEDASALIKAEIGLAKEELKEEAQKAAKTGGVFAGAGYTGHLALVMLSFAVAWWLAEAIPEGAAFLVVGIAYACLALALALLGRSRAKQLNPVPEQTVETVKEDVQWAKQRTN